MSYKNNNDNPFNEPVCEYSGLHAVNGACPKHGGDNCLIVEPFSSADIDKLAIRVSERSGTRDRDMILVLVHQLEQVKAELERLQYAAVPVIKISERARERFSAVEWILIQDLRMALSNDNRDTTYEQIKQEHDEALKKQDEAKQAEIGQLRRAIQRIAVIAKMAMPKVQDDK